MSISSSNPTISRLCIWVYRRFLLVPYQDRSKYVSSLSFSIPSIHISIRESSIILFGNVFLHYNDMLSDIRIVPQASACNMASWLAVSRFCAMHATYIAEKCHLNGLCLVTTWKPNSYSEKLPHSKYSQPAGILHSYQGGIDVKNIHSNLVAICISYACMYADIYMWRRARLALSHTHTQYESIVDL